MWHLIVALLAVAFVAIGFIKLFIFAIDIIVEFLPTFFIIGIIIAIFCLLQSCTAQAETFKYKGGLEINAKDYKTASRVCFNKLTGGKYPGEEQGLNIIDICVNPIKGKVK